MASAIKQMVESPELRAHHRAKAEQAAMTLNWEQQEQALVELYARILAQPEIGSALK